MVVGYLLLSACGGGGGDSDPLATPPSNVAQAKTLVAESRALGQSFRDFEIPASQFANQIRGVDEVTDSKAKSTLSGLLLTIFYAGFVYDELDGQPGSRSVTTDDGMGNTAIYTVTFSHLNPGTDRIRVTGEAYDSDEINNFFGGGDKVRNAYDVTLDFPSNANTAPTVNGVLDSMIANVDAEGVRLSFDGTLSITRRAGADPAMSTLREIGSLSFDGNLEIAQKQTGAVPDPLRFITLFDADLSGCNDTDCTGAALNLDGELRDSDDSTGIVLSFTKSGENFTAGVEFDAQLAGQQLRRIGVTTTLTQPPGDGPPVLNSVIVSITGGAVGTITITADQFDAETNPTRLIVADQAGTRMTLMESSNSPVIGTITVNGEQVATIEETSSGFIIRYVDGTIESLA
ncbi:MAG: hypothetical protein ACRETN_07365 [Nevskiales bacterium]